MRRILFIICCLLLTISTVKADWVPVNNGLGTRGVNSLCSYTSGGVNYIFAGTLYSAGSGVFVSTNDGNSWTLSVSIPNDIWALANTGNYIFAGTGNGLAYSSNNGANWYNGGLGHWIYSLAANGSYVYAGCRWQSFDPGGVYMSSNYGVNWVQTSVPVSNFQDVTALAINGNYVYAGGGMGIYKSTDYGANWSLSTYAIGALAFAIDGSNIFAGEGGSAGVYKSTNNGLNWSQTSLNNATITALQVYANTVFAGGFANGGGFFVSGDNGSTWVQKAEGMGSCVTLCISNGYIFAGTSGGGIYRRPLSELVGINTISEQVPAFFELKQNYPNPFNPLTKIKFSVSQKSYIQLRIYDVLGRLKEELVDKELQSAEYEVSFDGSNFASGTYFYQLIADNEIIDTKKFVIVK